MRLLTSSQFLDLNLIENPVSAAIRPGTRTILLGENELRVIQETMKLLVNNLGKLFIVTRNTEKFNNLCDHMFYIYYKFK